MDDQMEKSGKKKKHKRNGNQLDIRTILRQRDPESSFILFIVPVILILWIYFGKQTDFDQLFKGFQDKWNRDFYSAIYEYMTAFIMMFWIPYFIIKIVFKRSVREFGFQWGDSKYGFRFILITMPLVIWIVYVASSKSSIQIEYPLAKSVIGHTIPFLIVEFFYIVYYLSWEFLFRGFMLFGLRKQYGVLTAILIQTIPSVLIHIEKPLGESFGAILAGLIFGYLAVRTNSFVYPLILHATIGISIDLCVIMRLV